MSNGNGGTVEEQRLALERERVHLDRRRIEIDTDRLALEQTRVNIDRDKLSVDRKRAVRESITASLSPVVLLVGMLSSYFLASWQAEKSAEAERAGLVFKTTLAACSGANLGAEQVAYNSGRSAEEQSGKVALIRARADLRALPRTETVIGAIDRLLNTFANLEYEYCYASWDSGECVTTKKEAGKKATPAKPFPRPDERPYTSLRLMPVTDLKGEYYGDLRKHAQAVANACPTSGAAATRQ